MNINGYKLNNTKNFPRENMIMINNENYPYNNEYKSRYQINSLLHMKKDFNDNKNKNLNLEYFKNMNKKNEDEYSGESGNKLNKFNEIKNNIYANSNNLSNKNFSNKKNIYSSNKETSNFFNNFYNEDIQYMNMKIDLRVLEHKLNCLLNIYSSEDIHVPKENKNIYEENNYENNINNNENNSEENKYYMINDNQSNNNTDEIDIKKSQEIEYDNNSVNDQKMKMAIENVVSFNNLENLNEKINENGNKKSRIKKNNIIHLISDKTNELNSYDNIDSNNQIKEAIKEKPNFENNNLNNSNQEIKLNKENIPNIKNEQKEILKNDNQENIKNINNNSNDSDDNKNDDDIKNNDDNDNDDNADDNNKKNKEENHQMVSEKGNNIENIENDDNKNMSNQRLEKKVHFDENLIYINYDEDDYITELEITNQDGKIIPYKEKDFTRYLRLLTSVNPKKLQSNIAKSHKKRKKKKKTKIMERNIEFIKKIEKTGNLYNNNLKDYGKKTPNSDGKNCRKFMENPQHFFTEDLCDVMLLQYDIEPKDHINSNTSRYKKSKEKK